METSRGVDLSPYGATSNVYAAGKTSKRHVHPSLYLIDTLQTVVAIGGCVATDDATKWGRTLDTKLCGQFHVFNTVGQNDTTYTRDQCLASMQQLAVTNKCSRPEAGWCYAVSSTSPYSYNALIGLDIYTCQTDDPYVPQAQSDQVGFIQFGSCDGGDVRGYSFTGQLKVTTYTNTNPDISAYDIVWGWLQGRQKPFGAGQLGAHDGTVNQCNSTLTPATSWSYQRETCNLNTAFQTSDPQFMIYMPTVGTVSLATVRTISFSLMLAVAFILA